MFHFRLSNKKNGPFWHFFIDSRSHGKPSAKMAHFERWKWWPIGIHIQKRHLSLRRPFSIRPFLSGIWRNHCLWKYKILPVKFLYFHLYFIVKRLDYTVRNHKSLPMSNLKKVLSDEIFHGLATNFFYFLDSRNSREAIGSNLIRFRPIFRYKGKCY